MYSVATVYTSIYCRSPLTLSIVWPDCPVFQAAVWLRICHQRKQSSGCRGCLQSWRQLQLEKCSVLLSSVRTSLSIKNHKCILFQAIGHVPGWCEQFSVLCPVAAPQHQDPGLEGAMDNSFLVYWHACHCMIACSIWCMRSLIGTHCEVAIYSVYDIGSSVYSDTARECTLRASVGIEPVML